MHDEYVFKVYVILFSMRNNHYHSHVPVDKWLMLNKLHNNYMHKMNGDKVGTMPSQITWNAFIWVSCLHWCIICMFVWWMQPQNSLFHLYLFRSLSLCMYLRAFVNKYRCVCHTLKSNVKFHAWELNWHISMYFNSYMNVCP